MPRRVALLVNPTAGGGRAGSLVAPLVHRLRTAGAQVQVLVGRDAADAAALAGPVVAAGPDVLLAVGGDGLVGLAAQAVGGTGVALGVIPAGTGNDAARMLGIPLGPDRALDVVLAGRTRRIDLGRAGGPGGPGGRCFLTVLSCGFDSRVTERANAMTWPRGAVRYRLAMLAELPVFRPVPYVLTLDGEELRTEAMLVAVGNGPTYGAGMRVCPDADPADGLLDVTVVTPLSTAAFVRVFPSVYRGDHVHHPAVLTRRVSSVTLAAPGMTSYADGEPVGRLPLTVDCLPGALRVLVP